MDGTRYLVLSTAGVEGRGVTENPYYSQDTHGPYELFPLGDFVLEEGYTLRDCKLAYVTFGELNEAKDNAILVTTWYSGTHKVWSDLYIGPEHALNPEKYFIVVVNQIGKCVPPAPYPRSRNSRQHSSFCNIGSGSAWLTSGSKGRLCPDSIHNVGYALQRTPLPGNAVSSSQAGKVYMVPTEGENSGLQVG